jgi:hypothetical protein
MRSTGQVRVGHSRDLRRRCAEGDRERVGEARLGGDGGEVHAEVHDGLRDLRADAADDAVGAHEARAATVFSRCCATSVSTVGTPVMSMIAIEAPVSTIFCSRFSITTWVRRCRACR